MDRIDATWIDQWAGRYNKDYDAKLLNEIGPQVRERGHYDREALLYVGRWKTRGRTLPLLNANSDEEIRDITAMALNAELPYQHRILTLLRGVQRPTATALLMAWDKRPAHRPRCQWHQGTVPSRRDQHREAFVHGVSGSLPGDQETL